MWYMPYMRVRRAVLMYFYLVLGVSMVAVALRFWPGAVPTDAGDHLARAVHLELSMLVAAAAALVGGFATVLGLNLAAENDGHLELAWTKPVSREGYALGVFAVDIGAMAACIGFTTLCAALVFDVYAGRQAVALGLAGDLVRSLAFCGLPVCVYAWIAASSASLKRNRGVIAGLFWPFMFVLSLLPLLPVPSIHAAASVLNLFNPIAIFSASSSSAPQSITVDAGASSQSIIVAAGASSLWLYMWGWGVAALLLCAATFQWRRLQL
jgi:hypothetical protein